MKNGDSSAIGTQDILSRSLSWQVLRSLSNNIAVCTVTTNSSTSLALSLLSSHTNAAFKSGLCHLAEPFPQVQWIPAWVDKVQRVMPKGEVVPVPILCTLTFGAPMQGQARVDGG